jgi:hypothetical protein
MGQEGIPMSIAILCVGVILVITLTVGIIIAAVLLAKPA